MAEGEGGVALAHEGVDAEAASPLDGVGEISLVILVEVLDQIGRQDALDGLRQLLMGQDGEVSHGQGAVQPDDRALTDLQVDIRGLQRGSLDQEFIYLEHDGLLFEKVGGIKAQGAV